MNATKILADADRLGLDGSAVEAALESLPKHTPGPWDAEPIRRNYGDANDQSFFCVSYFPFINDYDGHVQTKLPVTNANAALIAAAPELLEALKEAEDYMSGVLSDEDERLIKVRTAIAMTKAEARA